MQSQKSLQSQHLPKQTSQYHHRPERPKTLDTQPSSLHALKSNVFNSSQSSNNSNPAKTPASEDELNKTDYIRSNKNSDSSANARLSVPNSTILAQKLSSGSSDKSMPFDEQEEWKKITEIMANFGTDTDVLPDSATSNNPNRRRDYQNRGENGRSNSIAGYTFTESDRRRGAIKGSESINSNMQRRSGTQSPHGQLMNFLYDNQLDELSNALYDGGYDDIDFIKGILDESDLDVLDIKPEFRKKLLAAIENDLQKPARAITTFTKSATDSAKSNAYHSMNMNHEKQPNSDSSNSLNHNNNSYSTIPKQKGLNGDDAGASLSVHDWLESIRLSQYAEVFR